MQVSVASAATTATSVAEPHKFVVTVGCFDLFHHGHSALLSHMRALGATKLLVGVHDDQSIFLNKKLVVGQPLPQRVKEVINFDPQLIEVFEVYEQDPTSALKNIYFHHQRLAQDKGYTIDWVYMRGKDMPMFPGRSFIESVMPIEWHDYSADISSTMIRNDVLPLAKSLANFAQDGCCNDNMLRLLERAATIDHKLVMKYVLQVMGERSPTLASATNASAPSTLQPLSLPPASFEEAPSAIDSVPHMHVASALAWPVTLETVNKNNRWLRLNTTATTTGINNSMSRRNSLTSDSTPDDHVSQSEADDASPSSARFHHHRYDDSSYSSANNSPRVNESSASPLTSDSPASVDGGKEKLLLSIIDGLFTLYRARVQQEK